MRLSTGVLIGSVLLAACAQNSVNDEHADHDMSSAQPAPAVVQDPNLPASAETAVQRLASSPRHGEWVTVRSGSDSIRTWVVYPERRDNAPVVVVISEIFGLSNWIRAVADQLAADGFIAVAPDLLTMKNVPWTEAGEPQPDAARAAIATIQPTDYHRQIKAVADYAMNLPAARKTYGVVGFCWGGSAVFNHAIYQPSVAAVVSYYGTTPTTEDIRRIGNAPVLGLYGSNDQRVNATIPRADSAMEAMGKKYEPHIYEGAGHGFLRQQNGANGANHAATRQAWPATVAWFRQNLK